MAYEWHESKNAANRNKHGIAFEDAVHVFDDPANLTEADRDASGEHRFRTLGRAGPNLLLLVVWTLREDENDQEITRIISARRATAGERRAYARQACAP